MAVAALQSANHEVGTVQPVERGRGALGDVPLFVDACASMGRLPLPDGLVRRRRARPTSGAGRPGSACCSSARASAGRNPFPGDDRIDERTTGFENVPAALAAAAALQAVVAERDEVNARQFALVDRIRAAVAEIPDVEVVGDPVDRLPHLVTFSCLYVDGEALVTELDRRGFGVASGSACTASTLEPSHVLAAMGVLTHGNVRVSLTRDTTEDEVDAFLAVLPGVVAGHPRGGRSSERRRCELDCRGMVCPMPVIELGKHLTDVEPGGVIAVVVHRRRRPRGHPGLVPDARPGVRRRGPGAGRHAALPRPPPQLTSSDKRHGGSSSRATSTDRPSRDRRSSVASHSLTCIAGQHPALRRATARSP